MSPSSPNNVPALAPPAGITPNFVNPYTLSPAFVATAIICLLFATAALIIRLATSLLGSNKRLRIEVCTCIASWLGLVVTVILTFLEIHHGLGRHQWNVRKSDIVPMLKIFIPPSLHYWKTLDALVNGLTILLQMMRIFVPTKRGLVYWLIQAFMWLNALFYTANVLSVIFQCSPIHKAWISSIRGHCVDTNLNLVVTGTINVISDVLILILPLWTIWHLKMDIRAKMSVSVVFMAGIFANFAGIMRLVFSIRIINGTDLTYLRLQHGMWTIAEITTAILCASLRLVPKFIALCRPRRPTLRSRSTYVSAGKSHGRSESTGSLRNSVELGTRSPEQFGWAARVKTESRDKGPIVVGAYVPEDRPVGIGWVEGREVDEGIRKTVTIEYTL
ncbi:hypothetical protein JMJ35_002126 [Cladonia borealis]|uniref:Rhodopsin domain-containing protein n=1 Tax=Cladonia borealis TaxID=184061 RepID=A0AA39R730_9LECA|nr:hypothetical protein JMJ35_002126 [Cladonia borealis]